jgi:hypothetical protein
MHATMRIVSRVLFGMAGVLLGAALLLGLAGQAQAEPDPNAPWVVCGPACAACTYNPATTNCDGPAGAFATCANAGRCMGCSCDFWMYIPGYGCNCYWP